MQPHSQNISNSFYSNELSRLVKISDQYGVSRNDLIALILAIKHDRLSLEIPEALHHRLLELYCKSSGLIQEIIHQLRVGSKKPLSSDIQLKSDRFNQY